jgi:hypothetical protein
VEINSIAIILIATCLSIVLVLLFGPSFHASYEDWKIKRGLR